MSYELLKQMMMQKKETELASVIANNEKTQRFGLVLTRDEAKELVESRNESLQKYQRIEFGEGILDKLIFTFCDSDYLNQETYKKTLQRLQDIFYEFKNRSCDNLTDDELLTFMREQYDAVCFGDLDYLEGTVLENFAEAVRRGYRGYQKSGGKGEYEEFDVVPRWDRELYLEVLQELFWG